MNQSSHPSEANLHAIDYWQVIKNRYGEEGPQPVRPGDVRDRDIVDG